jgi:PAS domain S-box-containing protein
MTATTAQTSEVLIANLSYVVIAVGNDGIINLWNRAAELVLGFQASEAVGQHANLVIPIHMQQAHGNCFTKSLGVVKEFAIRKDSVLPFMHKSGSPVKLRGHLVILRGPDGLPQGSAVIGAAEEGV